MQATNPLYKRIQVTRIIPETRTSATFELTPLDGWQPVYQSGQFITLVFTHHGTEERRSYSFSGSPELNEPMRITIKRVENGMYSRHLLDYTREGDILITSGISGYFRLPANTPELNPDQPASKQLFFLAAGSGITPVWSLIKTALHTTTLPLTLVYSNKSEEETIFYKELKHLQQQYPQRLTIEWLHSNQPSIFKSRLSSWLLQQLLKKLLNVPLEECMFFLCGPFDYMRTISITLLTAGARAANIKKEDFSSFKPTRKPQPPDIKAHQVEIRIAQQVYNITVQYPKSILAAAKDNGITLPYSCEAGRCGSCTATCVKGDIWMAYNEVLLDEEVARGRVLPCQGYPVNGNAEIHFE